MYPTIYKHEEDHIFNYLTNTHRFSTVVIKQKKYVIKNNNINNKCKQSGDEFPRSSYIKKKPGKLTYIGIKKKRLAKGSLWHKLCKGK